MSTRVMDINADMGEGFGRWTLGDDAGLMAYVTSANIACGFHAGDPHIMRRCVDLAVEHGVGIGAHVGFLDHMGFGRRRIDMTPSDIRDHVLYQIGALAAFATAAGGHVAHVKPHSALYRLCLDSAEVATVVASAVAAFDPAIVFLMSGAVPREGAARAGITFVGEALVDLEHDADGSYVPEWPKKNWDPEVVAARAVEVATSGTIPLQGGGRFPVEARSVCVHGDADNAVEIARTVRLRLAEAGVEVRPLSAITEEG